MFHGDGANVIVCHDRYKDEPLLSATRPFYASLCLTVYSTRIFPQNKTKQTVHSSDDLCGRQICDTSKGADSLLM
jgi:hypothetical protein